MPTVKPGSKNPVKDINTQDKTSSTDKAKSETKTSSSENGVTVKESNDTSSAKHSAHGVERIGNLRNKFESGELSDKKKTKKKSAPKMKYAGVESAKSKFIEEASKTTKRPENGPRGPKEFTPPPEGVAVGVLESNPQPRAPDVVTANDMYEPIDLQVIGNTTKTLKAKFKNLEATGGQAENGEKNKNPEVIEEINTVAPEATRSARARWKDIESGKTDKDISTERPKVDIHEGYGGVYENQPERFENIARAGETDKQLPAGISAKERRELFLKQANDASIVKKEPTKLIDINAAESGIYENEPTRLDNVVRYDDDQNDDYPSNSVKWASEAKNKFIQEAAKIQEGVKRTQPIAIVEEKLPNGSEVSTKEARYATQAKQAFLERQKQAEEAAKNKSRPDIIDIWGEQCADSGIFENTPAAHRADVVVSYQSDEEEEDDEEEQ